MYLIKYKLIIITTLIFFLGCSSPEQNLVIESKVQYDYNKNNSIFEKKNLNPLTVNEELFSKQDTTDGRTFTVKDLLSQFNIKKEEYCSNKINDLDDFPVDPSNICCNLNFMNMDPRKGKVHYGFDIPLVSGTPLKCPDKEDCLVVRTYPEWRTVEGMPQQTIYGESLLVYFKKAGYFGFYAHLKRNLGRQGRIFRYRELMAYSGNTGSLSTGPHLHFTIFRNQDCSNGVFDEKMRLAVIDTIEQIKIFEAKEKGLDPNSYSIEERSAEDIFKKCKVNLNQEANRACIAKNFPRDFIDPLEVTSDETIRKLVLEINPKRMSSVDILKLFTYHERVRNGSGIHNEVKKNLNNMPTDVLGLKEILNGIDTNILGNEM